MEELDSNCIDDLFEHQALTEQPAFVVKLCQRLNVRPHREPFDGLADDGLGGSGALAHGSGCVVVPTRHQVPSGTRPRLSSSSCRPRLKSVR
jgi:hypothetical protein